MSSKDQVIIVGGGLAGLVAAFELTCKKIPVVILDQENEGNLGGQAFWSLGGIFCVNSADQRRNGVKDNYDLALSDWMNTAKFDRDVDDHWPRQWAQAFVRFATDGMETYLKRLGVSFLTVGWAERGAGAADGHGNSLPRFHLTWGTGPELLRVFEEPVLAAAKEGLVTFKFRHRVDELLLNDDRTAVVGVSGKVLQPTGADRGVATSREPIDDFAIYGRAVLVATGGIGGNLDAVKRNWPLDRLGPKVPDSFVIGVPAHVDGRMISIAESAGSSVINMDRMWHYTEGLSNWNPIWPSHGIRVIPGPSSLWLDATAKRLPPFLYPGCDTLSVLRHICNTGYSYSWFIANRAIVAPEFALSGSEQNADITGKSYLQLLQRFFTSHGTPAVQAFLKSGADFVVEDNLPSLVEGMNRLATERNGPAIGLASLEAEIAARDAQLANNYTKDAQVMLIRNARQYGADARRVAKPKPLLDPQSGPLVAVRMNLLTRKSLGGLETDLDGQVLRAASSNHRGGVREERIKGLYAAGEAAGFGGGGMHGYSSLEGTFLGGCVFSGMRAGRAMAAIVRGEQLGGRARL